MNDEVYFWHAETPQNFLQANITLLDVYPNMPKVSKIKSLHIYEISPEKHGVEMALFPAVK